MTKNVWWGVVVLVLLATASMARGEPWINSVTGTSVHKEIITIQGSGFGIKNPAAPVLWDDCESAVVDNLGAVTGAGSGAVRRDGRVGWDYAYPWTSVDSSYNMQYRSSWYNMAHAHSRSTKYLAGGHYPDCGRSGPCNLVTVGYTSGPSSNQWYASFYLRLNPEWDDVTINGQNYKEIRIGNTGCVETDSCSAYWAHATDWNSVFGGTPNILLQANRMYCDGTYSPGDILAANPALTSWVKREYQVRDLDGYLSIKTNNRDAVRSPVVCDTGRHLFADLRSLGNINIGGYARAILSGGLTDSRMRRYFDDLYIDNTWSRVVLADNATYANATIVEPQIPSAWADNSISIKLNQGALPSCEIAYLYVFDSNNNVNSAGFPVRLVTGAGEGPCPPRNLIRP